MQKPSHVWKFYAFISAQEPTLICSNCATLTLESFKDRTEQCWMDEARQEQAQKMLDKVQHNA